MRRLVILIGASGSGKSAVARLLATCAPWAGHTFHLDDIGVPTGAGWELFEDGEWWQNWATAKWIDHLAARDADLQLLDGLISDCGAVVRQGVEEHGWFDLSTLKEPYRIEGKKTMGYEIFEQLGLRLPDAIVYPTGGGTGLIGMWKAFDEMERMGWIGDERPKMFCVQATGCAPIVRAWARLGNNIVARMPTPAARCNRFIISNRQLT